MSAAALLPQLYLLAAVFARIGALVMALPGFADSAVPVRVRLMIALGLSAALSGLVERHIALPTGEIALALLVVGEVAALATRLHWFGAPPLAGEHPRCPPDALARAA